MKNQPFNFGATVKQLNNIMEKRFNSLLKQWNLTYTQFSIIMYLLQQREQKINQKNIEETFMLKGSTVTGIIKRLEEKEFIKRQLDEHDRRINYLLLTEKGLALEAVVCKEVVRLEEETLLGISKKEKELLENIFNRVLYNLISISDM